MFRPRNIFTALLITAILIPLIYSSAFAGGNRRIGTAGAQELLIPVGSAGSALNGSNQAMSTGIDAIFWNPAGVDRSNYQSEVMFSSMNYIAGLDLTYIAVAVKFQGLGSLAFSLKNLDFGDIILTTEENTDGTGETFSPTYITGGLTFSRVMTDRIAFGVTAKVISESILRESAKGVALDVGVQYSSGPGGYRLGVVLKNLGPNMKFDGPDLEEKHQPSNTEPGSTAEPRRIVLQSFELPSTLELGLGYEFLLDEQNTLTLSSDFVNNNFSLDEFKFGAEYSLNNIIFLRGSYNIGYNSDAEGDENSFTNSSEDFLWGPSAGVGLLYDLTPDMGLSIDYAYQSAAIFDNRQWFTITLSF
ncbi:MAG: PorV/PorQ family protein [Candidatus Marinimicrobia bacterium]|nr:PorV/PorQ family protein [Candidatus Neomarinimicrobiota bacterium]